MALSTQSTETNPRLDWFAEPLTAIGNLFANQFSAGSATGREDADPTPGTAPVRLPPPTSELPARPVPIPGEPVDTSQARPAQSPAALAGAAPHSE
ncbi:hypothetical protein [Saccharopolyspora pogona]|uniref:hypothetical protein n=1 Tax=Saccharopolyspora pogona TaxID=333966 RepID=UPI001682976B|nr:hypothetical protein [Saccharopolyspora pogona]